MLRQISQSEATMLRTDSDFDAGAMLIVAAEASSEPSVIVIESDDGSHRIQWANRTFTEVVRVAPSELVGQSLDEFMSRADDTPLTGHRIEHFAASVRGRDGSSSSWNVTATPVTDGGVAGWFMDLRPLVERDAEELLRASEKRFQALAERAPIGIFSSEVGLRLSYVNDRMSELLGVPAEQMLGTAWMAAVHPEDLEAVTGGLQATLSGEALDLPTRLTTADGEQRWVNMRALSVHAPGKPATFVGTIEDVTERRQFEELLAWQATHDPLTSLPNRARLTEEITEAIRTAPDTTAVLFFDLDGFKEINDTLGHAAGDALLITVANRLSEAVRTVDLVFRLAGDEFVVLAGGISDDEAAINTAERLRTAVAAPMLLDGNDVHIGCSVGVVRAEPEISADSLLRDADAAMYEAKRSGKGRAAVLDVSARHAREEHRQLVRDVRDAVDFGQIATEFQPVVDAITHQTLGIEVAYFWEHPTRGRIQSDELMTLSREADCVGVVGREVVSQMCGALTTWKAAKVAPEFVSIRATAAELTIPGFVDGLARNILIGGLTSREVCVQVSDRELVAEPDRVIAVLNGLAHLQFRLALTDFGTSFASLAHLPSLPLDQLRIDRRLVVEAVNDSATAILVRSIGQLCQELGLPTVAQDVETVAETNFAVEAGLQCVQGPAIASMMSLDATTKWLYEAQR